MESATWCRTPAATSAGRRLRPEVSKNSSTALSSNEGELARSITTCAPATTSLSPSPVMVLTPLLGEAATTSWPLWRRMATVFEPISPVPPMTTIFMVYPPLSMTERSGGAWSLVVRPGRARLIVTAPLNRPLVADRERTAPHDLPRLRLPRADLPDHRRDERGWRHSLAKMQEHLHRRSMAPAESRVNKGARVAEGRRPSPHLAEDERRWQASSPVRVGADGTSQCCTRPTSRATRSAR